MSSKQILDQPGSVASTGPLLVAQLLPTREQVDLGAALNGLSAAGLALPFHPSRVDFIADVSRRLGRAGRGRPETQALAYWMRRAELRRLEDAFQGLTSDRVVLSPRGTVFHIPPANVDTLFVYSWALSTLVGNRNVVRLSSRATDQSNLILDTIRAVLPDHPDVARTSVMLTYGHEDAITAQISTACDVRVIWGGDETIRRVRSVPLPAHATELAFADRFSMACLSVDAYAELDEPARDRLAELFFNDSYWFDQLGCSSARLLLWVGSPPGELAPDFLGRVRKVAHAKRYEVGTATSIAKLAQAYRTMIDADVTGYSAVDNMMTVLDMAAFPDVRGAFCGGGLFYQVHATSLTEITPHIRRADQTLTVFGVPAGEVRAFVDRLQGRGIDRIVPFGQALHFSRYWDGYDLLAELTRRTTVLTSDGMP